MGSLPVGDDPIFYAKKALNQRLPNSRFGSMFGTIKVVLWRSGPVFGSQTA